jgi:hypothetical protein
MSKLTDNLMAAFSQVASNSLSANQGSENMLSNPMAGGIADIGKLFQSDSVTNGPNGFQFAPSFDSGGGALNTDKLIDGLGKLPDGDSELPVENITEVVTGSGVLDND